MKVRADEHVSVRLVEIIRDCANPAVDLDHVKEAGQKGHKDQHWITEFAESGGSAIISGDTDFLKTPEVVDAVYQTQIKIIALPPRYCNAGIVLQVSFVLAWWSRIETKLFEMKIRECYMPVWGISDNRLMKKVSIDFDKMHKKLRKQKRKKINNTKPGH